MHETNFTAELQPGRLEFEKSDNLISKKRLNSRQASYIVQ